MAAEEADPSPALLPEMVAEQFVPGYYKALCNYPDVLHRYYEDSSTISRPNLDGVMSSASTMQGISEKILSLEYLSCNVEISNVDAQQSSNDGVIVLVTGFLIGEGEKKRGFAQTFFLAKNAKGYFVLNDIFRFCIGVDEAVPTAPSDDVAENLIAPSLTEENQESDQVPDQLAQVKQSESVPEEINSNCPTSPYMNGSVDEKVPKLEQVVAREQPSTSSEKQTQEPPKMSYASMLAKKSAVSSTIKRSANHVVAVAPSANSSFDEKTLASPEKNTPQVPSPRNNAYSSLDKKTPTSLEKKMPASRQAPPPPRRNNAPRTSDNSSDGKGIYIGNLPPHIPTEELEKTFSEYGPIKKDGIQVRTYEDGFCYGFVEFESSDAATKAIEVRIFWFSNYKSYVTKKKSSGQVGNGNVRPSSRNGEFRDNDSNRRSRENSTEGRRDGGWYQNRNRGDFGPNLGPTNGNRNDSSFQNRASNGVGEQKRGLKPAPPTSVE